VSEQNIRKSKVVIIGAVLCQYCVVVVLCQYCIGRGSVVSVLYSLGLIHASKIIITHLVSCIRAQFSGMLLRHQGSILWYLFSGFSSLVSFLRHQGSVLWYLFAGIRAQFSGICSQVSGLSSLVSVFRHQGSVVRLRVSCIRGQLSGFESLVSCRSYLFSRIRSWVSCVRSIIVQVC
jgi:hypothetical protein